jgi:hypothetical protein
VIFRLLALSCLFLVAIATPARAADTTLRTFDQTDLLWMDAYQDRVAWTEDDGTLWTAEHGVATRLAVKPVDRADVAAGPDGKPVAVYTRGKRFYLYDFAAKRERALKSPGKVDNWAYWKGRFAVIERGRLRVGNHDVGPAKSLQDETIDFNGAGIAYVKQSFRDEDVEEFELAYWPATTAGSGRIVMRAAHGASGELSLSGAVVSPTKVYATQRAGEFGGPYRLWRVDLKTGKKEYAGLPSGATASVPVGAKQAAAYTCPTESELDDDDAEQPCRLILRSVTWRR